MKSIEIEKNAFKDLKYLWKILEINLEIVTFGKYEVDRNRSMAGDKEQLVLKDLIGKETHKCLPTVIEMLAGGVGSIIKGFKVEKKSRVVRVVEIYWLGNEKEMK